MGVAKREPRRYREVVVYLRRRAALAKRWLAATRVSECELQGSLARPTASVRADFPSWLQLPFGASESARRRREIAHDW